MYRPQPLQPAPTSSNSKASIRQNRPHQLGVIDLATRRVDGLEQLVDLVIAHLLAQIGQDVAQLADADEARHVLVEDLEAAAVFLRFARVAEAAGPVEDLGEGFEID